MDGIRKTISSQDFHRSVGAAASPLVMPAPQSPGLLARAQGLSATFADDHEMPKHGMIVYDALYAWCRAQRPAGHARGTDADFNTGETP